MPFCAGAQEVGAFAQQLKRSVGLAELCIGVGRIHELTHVGQTFGGMFTTYAFWLERACELLGPSRRFPKVLPHAIAVLAHLLQGAHGVLQVGLRGTFDEAGSLPLVDLHVDALKIGKSHAVEVASLVVLAERMGVEMGLQASVELSTPMPVNAFGDASVPGLQRDAVGGFHLDGQDSAARPLCRRELLTADVVVLVEQQARRDEEQEQVAFPQRFADVLVEVLTRREVGVKPDGDVSAVVELSDGFDELSRICRINFAIAQE